MDNNNLPPGGTSGDDVRQPEPAHVRQEDESDEELEATELRPIDPKTKSTRPRLSRVLSAGIPLVHWYDPIKKLWRHQVRISVPHEDCRDHLANERTFLGYLRTSIALSILGTVIAQLYRLQHPPHPSKVFGYYILSKPLSVIFQCAALCVILLGCIRFWRQQSAMAIGRVHAGGWEVIAIGIGSFLLLFMMFVVHVGIDIYKTDTDEP